MKSLQQVVEEGLTYVPPRYIQPVHARPCVSEVSEKLQIPVIDLSGLLSGADDRRATDVLEEIGRACEEWGFFQVVNHGVQQHVYDAMWAGAEKFFGQPPEERNRFLSDDHNQGVSYTASLDPLKEKILQWKDTLSIRRFPGICDGLEEAPQAFKAELAEYWPQVESLANLLYEAIFGSLGLTGAYLKTALPKMARVRTALNYYPTCPDPTLTFGVGPHSDSSCLTVLHAKPAPGLQIRRGDQWVAVRPLPYSFIINVADQIEILSNGKYNSVEHRVLASSDAARISIATFFGPTEDTKVAPLPKLVDENNPALYEETTFGDYMKYVFSGNLLPRKQSLRFAVKAPPNESK